MARRREYGWNPKVMARINARNISAGRKQYIDSRMNDDENYRSKYDEEVARLAGGQKAKATPTKNDGSRNMLLEGEERERAKKFNERFRPSGSMKAEAEDRTKKFKESFGKKGSMAAEYGYKSSFPTPISKAIRKAAEKPILQKSWEDINSRVA